LGKIVKALQDSPSDTELNLPKSLVLQRDEIGILSRELVNSRQQLIGEQQKRQRAERLAMLGQLTTSLAHEIKNPAASIIMHGQNLEKNEANPIGTLIQEEGEQIVSLVDQWLFVAKPQGSQHSSNDLVAILRHLLKKLQPVFDFHAVTLQTHFPEKLILHCDAQRIELVFRNLLSNSIHAMPEGGQITLTLADDGQYLAFSILDQGKGFSSQALEHFGEAFYSEREGGMGLGLTLVKEVIRAHGGSVEAANTADGGALVTGKLPKSGTTQTRSL
jgi:signal transduction histidine kinase